VDKRRLSTCAVGFEADPRYSAQLSELQASYRRRGWQATVFTETIVGTRDGPILFTVDNATSSVVPPSALLRASARGSAAVEQFQESQQTHSGNQASSQVLGTEIDIRRYIRNITKTYEALKLPARKLVVKMDLEGAEFLVLPVLLDDFLLCKTHIHTLFVEWHRHYAPAEFKARAHKFHDEFKSRLDMQAACKSTDIFEFDDKTFVSGDATTRFV
jgi:hypothetical protein